MGMARGMESPRPCHKLAESGDTVAVVMSPVIQGPIASEHMPAAHCTSAQNWTHLTNVRLSRRMSRPASFSRIQEPRSTVHSGPSDWNSCATWE